MTEIDARYENIHQQLSDAIEHASKLPYDNLKQSLHILMQETASPSFFDQVAENIRSLSKRVMTVQETFKSSQAIFRDVIASSANYPPGLKEELVALSTDWSTLRETWLKLMWDSRMVSAGLRLKQMFVEAFVPFVLDDSVPLDEKKEEILDYLEILKHSSATAKNLDDYLGRFRKATESCVKKWSKILYRHALPIDDLKELDDRVTELETLEDTYSDLSDKVHQLSIGSSLFPVGSGISSSLSSVFRYPWIGVLTHALGQGMSVSLGSEVTRERDEIESELAKKTAKFHELEGDHSGFAKLHINLWYTHLEVGAITAILETFVIVWTSLIHDVMSIAEWDGSSTETYTQHLKVVGTMYSTVSKALREFQTTIGTSGEDN